MFIVNLYFRELVMTFFPQKKKTPHFKMELEEWDVPVEFAGRGRGREEWGCLTLLLPQTF